jgi:hypothetical protein
MTVAIIILAYVANIFFNRWLTYLAVKNQGKGLTVSYDAWGVWFVPGIGNIWCLLDFLFSLSEKDSKWSNWFNGKHW